MAVYTTQLRTICELQAGYSEAQGYNSLNEILDKCWNSVIPDYPIYDEAYRKVLNTKILKHFYTREIGLETVGLWKLKLDTKLNEIMPYYNQLYKSAMLDFNPLYDVDLTKTFNENSSGGKNSTLDDDTLFTETHNNTSETTDSGTSSDINHQSVTSDETSSSKNVNRFSDTPQGALTAIESNNYLTTATVDDNTGSRTVTNEETGSVTNSSSRTVESSETQSRSGTNNKDVKSVEQFNDTRSYTEKIAGKQGGGSFSKMIDEYRNTLINIDMMIIEELEPLFFILY